jgi:hypothetical protein
MSLTSPTKHGQETTQPHTRLLRMGLAETESREYWRQAARILTPAERTRVAFEERWFGSRSMTRVQYLVQNFLYRFDAFPTALRALHSWNPSDPADRRVLCHWHLQLSDPMYRSFTGTHLPERLHHPEPTLDRNAISRWVESYTENRWAPATTARMVAGLMGVLNEVGYAEKTTPLRPFFIPRVSDQALAYLLYLLRETHYNGQLDDNAYLASLAIQGAQLEARLVQLPGLSYRKMSNVKELSWEYPDLCSWAMAQ